MKKIILFLLVIGSFESMAQLSKPSLYGINARDIKAYGGYSSLRMGKLIDSLILSFQLVGGGGVTWGSITGTLSSQTDLQSALDAKESVLTFTSPLSRSTNIISIANSLADGSTKGAASFETNDFNATLGNISLDYTNGQAASGSTKGFLTSSDWTNFNTAYNRSGTSLSFSASTFTFTKQDASTLTVSVPTFNQNTSGSAATLTTSRNIQGVAFNGSANIDIINGTGFVKATGTTLSYDNSTYLTTSSATSTYLPIANPTYTGQLSLGTLSYSDTGILGALQSSTNSYNQFIIQNTNSGSTASTNFIVSNDLGTASTHYAEFGKNSSSFSGSGSWSIANASYLDEKTDELAIGTIANKTLHFFTNSSTTDRLSIDGNGLFTFNSPINGSTWLSTWTASANSQVSKTFTDNVTLRSTASDGATGIYINPTLTLASTTQNPVGLNIDVTYVQSGLTATTSATTPTTLAGMTATTYTGITPASSSLGGTGVYTVVVGSATSITSITATSGTNKVNEVLVFNGSQFGSGSGSASYTVRTVTGVSLGTSQSALRLGLSGANFLDNPKILEFYYQGAALGNIGAVPTASNSLMFGFSDNTSTSFYLHPTNGATFVKGIDAKSTLDVTGTMTGASVTFSGIITGSRVNGTGASNTVFAATGAVGGFLQANAVQSKFKTSYSLGSGTAGVGLSKTLSLTTGGTGYTTGTKATTGGTGTGLTVSVTTVSGGVITVISSTPVARGSGYSINDVVTVSTGGANATVTITAVDEVGSVVSFEDASSITDASSNNRYITTLSRPTFNITSGQAGTIAALYFDPTLTATGSFNKYGIIIAPTTFSSGFGTASPTATMHVVGTTKLDGNVTLVSPGNKFFVTEGSNGSVGQTALVSGTKAITVTGTTTSSRCFLTRAVGSNASLTVKYDCACTADTVTITAEIAGDTINTSDTSTLNYWIVN